MLTPEQVEKAAPLVAKFHELDEQLAAIQSITPIVVFKRSENEQIVVILTDEFAKKVRSQVSDSLVLQLDDLRTKLRELGVSI